MLQPLYNGNRLLQPVSNTATHLHTSFGTLYVLCSLMILIGIRVMGSKFRGCSRLWTLIALHLVMLACEEFSALLRRTSIAYYSTTEKMCSMIGSSNSNSIGQRRWCRSLTHNSASIVASPSITSSFATLGAFLERPPCLLQYQCTGTKLLQLKHSPNVSSRTLALESRIFQIQT